MDILSRIRFESKTAPGVAVTFRRSSVIARDRFLEAASAQRTRVRELYRERKPLDDEYRAAIAKAQAAAKSAVDQLIEAEGITRQAAEARVPVKPDISDEKFERWVDLTDEIQRLERDGSGRATLRSLLVSIEGFTIDGRVPGAAELIEEADCALTDELVQAANEIAQLSPAERGESPWPGISARAAAGPKKDTNAPPASSEADPGSTAG